MKFSSTCGTYLHSPMLNCLQNSSMKQYDDRNHDGLPKTYLRRAMYTNLSDCFQILRSDCLRRLEHNQTFFHMRLTMIPSVWLCAWFFVLNEFRSETISQRFLIFCRTSAHFKSKQLSQLFVQKSYHANFGTIMKSDSASKPQKR